MFSNERLIYVCVISLNWRSTQHSGVQVEITHPFGKLLRKGRRLRSKPTPRIAQLIACMVSIACGMP